MNKEKEELMGMIVSFNEPSNPEELNMMLENGIYPAVIRFPLSYEYLVEHGNHYCKIADTNTYGDFYNIELSEKNNVFAIIPKDQLDEMILVASTEYEASNDATFISLSGERFKVSDYVNEIKESLLIDRPLV